MFRYESWGNSLVLGSVRVDTIRVYTQSRRKRRHYHPPSVDGEGEWGHSTYLPRKLPSFRSHGNPYARTTTASCPAVRMPLPAWRLLTSRSPQLAYRLLYEHWASRFGDTPHSEKTIPYFTFSHRRKKNPKQHLMSVGDKYKHARFVLEWKSVFLEIHSSCVLNFTLNNKFENLTECPRKYCRKFDRFHQCRAKYNANYVLNFIIWLLITRIEITFQRNLCHLNIPENVTTIQRIFSVQTEFWPRCFWQCKKKKAHRNAQIERIEKSRLKLWVLLCVTYGKNEEIYFNKSVIKVELLLGMEK